MLNYEYIANHITDFIEENTLFDIFESRDIKHIMKYAYLTSNEFINLIKQSHSTIDTDILITCTKNTSISIKDSNEAIKLLKSARKYMKLRLFDELIDILNQKDEELADSAKINENLRKELSIIQNQKQSLEDEILSLKSKIKEKEEIISREEYALLSPTQIISRINQELNELKKRNTPNNYPTEFLSKIAELKNSTDFESIYKFFDELSEKGNQNLIRKACEEGLWEKREGTFGKNVLIQAYSGNTRLVKSLVECGCDFEAGDNYAWNPLIWASDKGHLEVVKYLISVGANKEAKDNCGKNPLIWAAYYSRLEVVKYLVSIGVDIEATTNRGHNALMYACERNHLDVAKYLISSGANKEAKNNSGFTPLIVAASEDQLEIIKYLISIGANKNAKDNEGKTALDHAKEETQKYLKSV